MNSDKDLQQLEKPGAENEDDQAREPAAGAQALVTSASGSAKVAEGVGGEAEEDLKADSSVRTPVKVGLAIIFLVFGFFGVWAVTAPLEEAAHASGTVTVKSHTKTIQHLEGGIVKEISVKSGELVHAGDTLVVLENTQPISQLEILNGQYYSVKALESRLIAEREGHPEVIYPEDLVNGDSRAQEAMAAQNSIFQARRNTVLGEKEVLEQRVEQLESKIVGLKAQREAKRQEAVSYQEEIVDLRELLEEGYADKLRLRELERSQARLQGEIADISANISATEIQIGETRLQILQKEKEFLTEVVDQLGEVQAKLEDLKERITATEDVVRRTIIRAPVDGVVHGLQVHTIGGVLAPGEPIAEIVPQQDAFVVEAQISPNDIDRIYVGQDAKIRFSAFSRRTVPAIEAKLIGISADRLVDENTGEPYFLARLEVTETGAKDLEGLVLHPGMPAEVFITTGSRTFLQYLLKPITNALARSMKED